MASTYEEIIAKSRELHAQGDIAGAKRLAQIAIQRRSQPSQAERPQSQQIMDQYDAAVAAGDNAAAHRLLKEATYAATQDGSAPDSVTYNPNTGRMVDLDLKQDPLLFGGRAGAAAQGVGQGVSFGAMDEAVGGLFGAIGPGTFEQNQNYALNVMRHDLQRSREQHPVVTTGAEIAGAVAVPSAAWGAVGTGGKLARVGKGMAVGGAEGALYGFNTGEGGAGNRAENARNTAAWGAAFGGAAPVVGDAAQSVLGRLMKQRAINRMAKSAPTLDDLRQRASAIYAQADNVGGFNRADFDAGNQQLKDYLLRHGMDPDLTPKAATVSSRFDDAATAADPNMTFRELDTLRKKAGVPAGDVTNRTEQALGSKMAESIDDFVDVSNPGLGSDIAEARKMWGQMRRAETMDEAFARARNQASGEENGIRIQIRRILNNPRLRRGFSAEEIAQMERVVRGTAGANILKKIGKVGVGIGQQSNVLGAGLASALGGAVGSTMGPVGAAIGAAAPVAVGTLAQRLGERATQKAAQTARGLVLSGGRVNAPRLSAMQKLLLERIMGQGGGRGSAVLVNQ
ncbi:hypothetical protein [Paracoccus sp. AS002]|uniref:hypothetical protein n=1 Tax=Paracoccus sp. AS002 TaxID=3019545 RepID=UPI0023E85C64|nr:hypothetical protein [Paracoccus sp. AS002]MDF3904700.1 hypothetical protein [Paracoccus sp. AS002]